MNYDQLKEHITKTIKEKNYLPLYFSEVYGSYTRYKDKIYYYKTNRILPSNRIYCLKENTLDDKPKRIAVKRENDRVLLLADEVEYVRDIRRLNRENIYNNNDDKKNTSIQIIPQT